MSDQQQIRMVNFLRNQIVIKRTQGEVARFELRHLPVGTKIGHEVLVVEARNDPDDEWYETVAAQILSAMEADAQGLPPGVQSYCVLVFRTKDAHKITARSTHRVSTERDDEENASIDSSEPATKHGMLSQLMRHNEALFKSTIVSTNAIMQTMQRTLMRLSEQNEKMQEQRIDTIETLEQLHSMRDEREIAKLQAENKQKMVGELIGEVKLLGPAIVNRLSGKQVLPEKTDPQILTLKRLLESLTDEQKMKVLDTLDNDQKIALGELLQVSN